MTNEKRKDNVWYSLRGYGSVQFKTLVVKHLMVADEVHIMLEGEKL